MWISKLFFALLLISTGYANTDTPTMFDIELQSGEAISISQFGEKGDRILWIPSEYGVRKAAHYQLMNQLSNYQHEIWLAELHDSYFITSGRSSLTKIPASDIAELIQKSIPKDGRKLFLATSSRGAILTLLGLREWQQTTGSLKAIAGLALIHPNFQAQTPSPGQKMEFFPLVDSVKLPIFLIQPDKSSKYWHVRDLVKRLSNAGSEVFVQIVEDAGDGYFARSNSNESEKQRAKELPLQLAQALNLLAQSHVKASIDDADTLKSSNWNVSLLPDTLQQYPNKTPAPDFTRTSHTGEQYRLSDYRGKVVVLNFWATWCPPCVREIPSLGRLQAAFPKTDLVVLSVDVGESKADVAKFLAKIPADFPVLLDEEGLSVNDWNVQAFPTTYVIDQQGIIRLAYYGGLEWDDENVIRQLTHMVAEKESS
ncbi:MAG: Unknown protein [uncultured Thiotrichaceae bacterium]|uniref:Thioredoxin domain-containing protein n=1 Tax=uncultured Thiotrichaceae bacterium TaxID=298394 RepID=A0A6S6SDA0_9GAMM|nr:MAG: Unknown protein [uncultured Thiotrichaceae bacterium]